jgi:hypothetical protein
MPGHFLVGFTRGLMERREQLLRQNQPPETARAQAVGEAVQAFAVGEVLEGERVGEEFPLPWWRSQADPSERTRPDGRADRARTREAGHER